MVPSIHFLKPSKKIIVKTGSDVRLECRAHGHPKPVIRWGRQVIPRCKLAIDNLLKPQHNQPFTGESGNKLSVRGEVLYLRNITRAATGEYICKAKNGVGHGAVREALTLDVLCE